MKKSWKRILSAALAAVLMVSAVAGCGGEKKAETPKPAATIGEKVKINFPTASASGALYAVGAAITNTWNKTVPGISAGFGRWNR